MTLTRPAGRLHVFADEAGCMTFERKANVSRYFILCTIVMRDCTVGNALLDLRRMLAWKGAPLGEYFHASDDKQEIRNAVFAEISRHAFTVQATIVEKSKVLPQMRERPSVFYQDIWYYHLKHGLARQIPPDTEALVTAAALGTRKDRIAFSSVLVGALGRTMDNRTWRTDFPPAHADPCVQVADYCAWAIQRKWEKGDGRSYDLIKDRINYSYDLWSKESTHYY